MINEKAESINKNFNQIKHMKEKFNDKLIISEKNNLIQQRNDFNLSLRKKKLDNDIMKYRNKKKNMQNIQNNNQENYIEYEKYIPQNIILEFHSLQKGNKISIILKYLNISNENDKNYDIRKYCLIHLSNYLNESNKIDLNECNDILKTCFQLFFDDNLEKNKILKIQIQYELLLIFIELAKDIPQKNPSILFYDEIFLKHLSNILNSKEYNYDFKNNIFKLISHLIYEKPCFKRLNKYFIISEEICKFLPQVQNDEYYNSIFYIMHDLIIHTNSDDEMNDDNYIIYFKDIFIQLIIMLDIQYKKYKTLYNNKVPNIQLSIYYRNIKYLLRFFRVCLYKRNIKFYFWTLIQNKQFCEYLIEILKDFSQEFFKYFQSDKNINVFKLNNNISIEIQPKIDKYILYNEKIFRIITYNFAFLFAVTIPDENKDNMLILKNFYDNIREMKLISLYILIIEKSLQYHHLDYSSLKIICILINNYSIENLTNIKEIIKQPSILKLIIDYFKFTPQIDFRREFLKTINNIILINDKEVLEYIISSLGIIKLISELIINDYKNSELMLLSLEIINTLIDIYNEQRMYKAKNEIIDILETTGAIYIIKDHLTLSNNDDISEIATIIVCYLSDLAIDNQTDIFKNFNGENESDSENTSI